MTSVLGWTGEKLERFERYDRKGISDARDRLHFLRNKMANVLIVLQIELHQQIIFTRGRENLRCYLPVCNGGGHLVGLTEFTFNLDEKGAH
jgi:hypothetical protein